MRTALYRAPFVYSNQSALRCESSAKRTMLSVSARFLIKFCFSRNHSMTLAHQTLAQRQVDFYVVLGFRGQGARKRASRVSHMFDLTGVYEGLAGLAAAGSSGAPMARGALLSHVVFYPLINIPTTHPGHLLAYYSPAPTRSSYLSITPSAFSSPRPPARLHRPAQADARLRRCDAAARRPAPAAADVREVPGSVGHGRVGWVRAGRPGSDDRLGQERAQVSV